MKKIKALAALLIFTVALTGCTKQRSQQTNSDYTLAAGTSISEAFIEKLNSVIDNSKDIEALSRDIKNADTENRIDTVRVFERPQAFIDNNPSSVGVLKEGAIVYVSFNDGKSYITSWCERTKEPIPIMVMFTNIICRANSVEQLAAEIDGYNLGLGDRKLTSLAVYKNYDDARNDANSRETVIENGKLIAAESVWENNAAVRVTYNSGQSWFCYNYNGTGETSAPINLGAIGINSDVVWGIGKTIDEITEKYGDVTGGYPNVYTFENGYGIYVWEDTQTELDKNVEIIRGKGGCKSIGKISARDFLIGDLSTVTLDNIASKCGFEVVPLNPVPDGQTMYDGYKCAYYTHPSYENMTFIMLYKESGFDEDATFDIKYDDNSSETESELLSNAEVWQIVTLFNNWGDLDYNIHPDRTNTNRDYFPDCVDSSQYITEEITPRGSNRAYTEYFYKVVSGDYSTEAGFNEKLDDMFTEKFKEQYFASSEGQMFRFKDGETYVAGRSYYTETEPMRNLKLIIKIPNEDTVEISVANVVSEDGEDEYRATLVKTDNGNYKIDAVGKDDGSMFGIPQLFHYHDLKVFVN